MIYRKRRTLPHRWADPFAQALADYVLLRHGENPFRDGTPESDRYNEGLSAAAKALDSSSFVDMDQFKIDWSRLD